MHRNTMRLPTTRLSRVLMQAGSGFMIIELANSVPVRNYPRRIRTHQINRCQDQPDECLETGRRYSTNRNRIAARPFSLKIVATRISVLAGLVHDWLLPRGQLLRPPARSRPWRQSLSRSELLM